ncbi:threonylcarbamoyladenosine tRNA methylthiotransferase MtaB [Clostridiales Family XIII bacterium PM5-7]
MKIAFHTLGCKVNQYETEAMKEQFAASGHQLVDEEDFADAYVINSCTVTNLADRKSRQYIRKVKRINPEAVVAVTGCYAQVSPTEVCEIEEVDIVAGTNEKQNLLSYIEEFRAKGQQTQCHIRAYEELNAYQSTGIITSMESRTRAYIKIQEGCNRFCAYCIIPYARGQVRSRDLEEIVAEAKGLIAGGFKEIILTGINTALYGADLGDEGIAPLIKAINDLEGDFRIRLSSLEPTVINADYVKSLLGYEKLCPHLHLSIQSGADHVLALMNRRYGRQEYLDIVKVLKEHDPLYGITTDIIVGFPGEREEDFADSVNIVEEAGFLKVHTFKYSKRKGTKAADMAEQVSDHEKMRRSKMLMKKADEAATKFFAACQGETRRVLIEEATKDGLLTGYTDNYVKVYIPGTEDQLNQFEQIKLLEPYKDGMKGEINNG